MKKFVSLLLALLMIASLAACGKKNNDNSTSTSGATSYKVGICNYVDDASLNQIVDNIKTQLAAIGQEKGVTFEISYDNCNADSAVLCAGSAILLGLLMTSSVFVEPLFIAFVASKAITATSIRIPQINNSLFFIDFMLFLYSLIY